MNFVDINSFMYVYVVKIVLWLELYIVYIFNINYVWFNGRNY